MYKKARRAHVEVRERGICKSPRAVELILYLCSACCSSLLANALNPANGDRLICPVPVEDR